MADWSIGGGLNAVGGFLGFGPQGGAQTYNSQYQVPQFNNQYNRYEGLSYQYGNRNAPQAQAFTAGESGFRNGQTALGRQYALEAQGQGVGQQVVRQQAQQAANRAMSGQMAMAAGARPGMGAQAYQGAALNAANAQSRVGEQASMAGAQMQLGAMNQYGNFLQGARGQDLQRAQFNAGQQQQGSQFNADAQLRQYGLNDQAQLEALRQRMQLSGMQQQGGLAYNQALQNYNMQPSAGQGLLGFAGGLAGGYFGMRGSQQPQQPAQGGGGGYPYGFNPYNY